MLRAIHVFLSACAWASKRASAKRLVHMAALCVATGMFTACGGGGGSGSPPVEVPQAPSGGAATAGNGEVAVSWTGVGGATSYNIYRSTTAGTEGAKVGASSTTTYMDTSVVNGTTYYYSVTADNTAGEGAASAQSAAVTPEVPVMPPQAPTGVTATAGNAQVTISWTAVFGATSYNLYRSTAAGTE
jgi:fibronectin type 3 domain-containing protein